MELWSSNRRVSSVPWYQVHMRSGSLFSLAVLVLSLGCGPSQSPELTTTAYEAPIDERDNPKPNCQDPEYVVSSEAKSAFEKAEKFYATSFLPFKIHKSLRTKEHMEELNKLIEISNLARQNYLEIAKYGRTEWALPAQVRIGDVFHFQARKIIDHPTPLEIVKLDGKFPEKEILRQFQETLYTAAFPMLKKGRSVWAKSVKESEAMCTDNDWTKLAQDRLAANKEPTAPLMQHQANGSRRSEGTDKNVSSPKSTSGSVKTGRTSVLTMANAMKRGPSVNCTDGNTVAVSADYDAKLVRKHCTLPGGRAVPGPILLLTFDTQIVAKAERKNDGEIRSCQLLKPELLASIRSSRFRAIATACEK